MQLIEKLRTAGLIVTTAESCTGGMVAAAITDVPGSSAVFEMGFVTYSNAAKVTLLGVQEDTLARFGAVAQETAQEMAEGARQRSGADIAVAITGIAGPGGSEFKPEGRVCFGLATGATTTVETREFGALGREYVRRAARDHALLLLDQACP